MRREKKKPKQRQAKRVHSGRSHCNSCYLLPLGFPFQRLRPSAQGGLLGLPSTSFLGCGPSLLRKRYIFGVNPLLSEVDCDGTLSREVDSFRKYRRFCSCQSQSFSGR